MRSTSIVWLIAFVLFLVVPPPVAAQESGGVVGTVTSFEGEPIATVQVFIEELGRGTLTRNDGRYVLANLPSGSYTLNTTIIGYRPASAEVTIRPGETVTVDFVLDQDYLNLESVVVTATQAPRTKLESSSAVTNLPAVEIALENPRSTADLLKAIPGFYVESSGGEVGGNLFARGLPADGSFRYVAMMEDGMPVYDATELFFVNADIFVRVDENIERIEGVRGGNSALYGSNAPGGVINFISHTGGPEFSGSMKTEVGTDGLARFGLNANGPLGDEWRFNVGGFYRYDDGVRDPGFPASNGGQLKANITRLFDGGHVRLYGKLLNDRNIFFLPLPFQNPDDPEFVPGFPDDGTLTTADANYLEVPLPTGDDLTLPLEHGQQQEGGSLMLDVAVDLGDDWQIQNTARAMSIDHTWNALLPFEIVDADDWAQGFVSGTPDGAGYDLTYRGTSQAVNTANGLLSLGGLWHVHKPMSNFSNQLQVQRLFSNQRLTFGGYFGYYEAGNTWYFNDVTTTVDGAPRLVDLTVEGPMGEEIRQVTENGFRRYLSNYVNAQGNVTLFSLFAGNEIELTDRLRLDLGARYEWDTFEQNVENTGSVTLGLPTEADDGMLWGDRSRSRVDVSFEEWAASVGVNYKIGDDLSVYGRGSRGYKMPILDQFLFALDPAAEDFPDIAETLWQAEAGVKLASRRVGLSAVAYWLQLSDFPSQDAVVRNGETVFVTRYVGEARTIGLEGELVSEPVDGLSLNATVTLQDPVYTSFVSGGEDFTDNRVRRIPQLLLNLEGGYQLPFGVGVGLDWNYVGMRYSNNANTVELPAFHYLNGRLEYLVPESGVTLQLGVLNAFDGQGLTEGNPRVDETVGAQSTIFLARPILPRRWTLTARYSF